MSKSDCLSPKLGNNFVVLPIMSKRNKIVVVDDSRGVLAAVSLLLRPHFNQVITLQSPVRLEEVLREGVPDCVLLDMNFSAGINTGNEGIYWLNRVKRLYPELPVVLFTAYGDIDLAVRGMKEGAVDFIIKPWDNARLVETLLNASGGGKSRKADNDDDNSMYWGESKAMTALRSLVERIAPTDANVLITGENGTGKEVLARAIHMRSSRHSRPMLVVDMGSVTETLFESELFGHVKGAFTNASADRPGKFEAADGSTLFMDEIGNLPPYLQSKLLTAIQSRKVVRVGSNKPVDVDIRLICATNCDLQAMVAAGRFRQDLLYRINTIHLEIPPLRDRKEDIVPLAELFMRRFSEQYKREASNLDASAREKLMSHMWPGNIRELEHAVEKAVIISDGPVLNASHFDLPKSAVYTAGEASGATLEDMERQMITAAVNECHGNLSAVASRLGITRQTLYNKMKKFGL